VFVCVFVHLCVCVHAVVSIEFRTRCRYRCAAKGERGDLTMHGIQIFSSGKIQESEPGSPGFQGSRMSKVNDAQQSKKKKYV